MKDRIVCLWNIKELQENKFKWRNMVTWRTMGLYSTCFIIEKQKIVLASWIQCLFQRFFNGFYDFIKSNTQIQFPNVT